MGWAIAIYSFAIFLLSTLFIDGALASKCTPPGSTPVCSWTSICVPQHKPSPEPAVDPKKLPPLPGYRVSCNNEEENDNDWNHDCVGGLDIELTKCELNLGGEGEGNNIQFTVKNHSRILTHTSSSARWGHLGINPTAQEQPANDPALPANPDRDDQATFEADYPQYKPDYAMSESFPNPITMAPLSETTFRHAYIHDFPPMKACKDVVYLYVTQDGYQEPPHLWNRNYSCDIEPCYLRNFRKCKVNRGSGGGKSKSVPIPVSAPLKE